MVVPEGQLAMFPSFQEFEFEPVTIEVITVVDPPEPLPPEPPDPLAQITS